MTGTETGDDVEMFGEAWMAAAESRTPGGAWVETYEEWCTTAQAEGLAAASSPEVTS